MFLQMQAVAFRRQAMAWYVLHSKTEPGEYKQKERKVLTGVKEPQIASKKVVHPDESKKISKTPLQTGHNVI